MAGYSGTPLPQKLGIKHGQRLFFANAPAAFPRLLGKLPQDAKILPRCALPLDVALLFARSRAEFAAEWPRLAAALAQNGMLWAAWPQKASGVATDLGENWVREFGLARGLV